MIKRFCLLFVFFCGMSTMFADPILPGGMVQLVLNVKPIKIGGEHTLHPKSPVLAPCVYQDGNQLTFDAAIEGCIVQLVDENEDVVFSDSIEENQTSLVLPSTLTGTYELQIIQGDYMFYCEIEL